ncbi:MAG: flagellar filament capping protein FliD [Sterolibacteriaceae bacterium MAG5]|nr:flagellar filament capping protein FliD [Candidatus Nitricoxidireducens bremensis]
MDISSIVSSTLQLARVTQSSQTGSTSGVGSSVSAQSVGALLAPATKRLGQQLESTNVRLSAYGQIKSAFAATETAARGLTETAGKATATTADVTKAAQALVSAFNQTSGSLRDAVQGTGSRPGALASDVRAQFAANDLARSITGTTEETDLKAIGITRSKEGTLSLDVKALEQALATNPTAAKSTLAALGGAVGATAERELATTGNVGASVGSLTSRSQSLSAQQASLQKQAETLQATLDAQNAVLNYTTASGLSAYRSLLG